MFWLIFSLKLTIPGKRKSPHPTNFIAELNFLPFHFNHPLKSIIKEWAWRPEDPLNSAANDNDSDSNDDDDDDDDDNDDASDDDDDDAEQHLRKSRTNSGRKQSLSHCWNLKELFFSNFNLIFFLLFWKNPFFLIYILWNLWKNENISDTLL